MASLRLLTLRLSSFLQHHHGGLQPVRGVQQGLVPERPPTLHQLPAALDQHDAGAQQVAGCVMPGAC